MAPKVDRKAALERELLFKKVVLGIGTGLAGLTCILLFIVFGGDTTQGARDMLGLSALLTDQNGVYADCSKAANRYNKFCRGDYSSTLKRPTPGQGGGWDRPGNSLPFSLNSGNE